MPAKRRVVVPLTIRFAVRGDFFAHADVNTAGR
jgi:hypothetical protein